MRSLTNVFGLDTGHWALALCTLMLGAGCSESPAHQASAGAALTSTASVTFKTIIVGDYLTAEGGGGGVVNANRTVASTWETFTLTDLNGGSLSDGDQIYLQALDGDYVTAEGGGGGAVNANRTAASTWETFIIHRVGGGAIHSGDQIWLQTLVLGDYVSAVNGGGAGVTADRTAAGTWETFAIGITGAAGGGGAGGGGTAGSGGGTAGGGSGSSDIVGKITVGYQGWFTAPNDGSGVSPPWWHWTNDRQTPTANDIAIKAWPDMTEYTKGYASGFANLGNGKAATLFSSYDASTVDTHARWMEENGIDTIALQRFADLPDIRDVVAANVRAAAEAHGRKFYVMYDISGWTNFDSEMKTDWMTRIQSKLGLTNSPAYARHDGKPVVCIWGLGYLDRPGDPTTSLDIVTFFKNQGIYVIGGVGPDWRTPDGKGWSKTGFGDVYNALDAISPWMIGVIGTAADSDNVRTQRNAGDVAYCHTHGIAYQPCVLPGDLSGGQRKHGDFMWHQFGNLIQAGADGLYVSMFDEFNEGNQIAKTAAVKANQPTDAKFNTLDEDGTACSSDYYLRLTGDGGRMLKGQIPFSFTRPTPTM